ncbi:MAG: aldo/keto reductase [Clostridia bacterium]|nr:aldo/keto reductase [Clostridia bacterium]
MQYRVNPRNGQELSALGFGCMRFTRKGGAIDQEKANRELKRALDLGVNYFDTAYAYAGSEEALGKFIKAYDCRDRLYIATKLPQYRVKSAADFDAFFDEELRRLQTDHVDYYLMHMMNDAQSFERLCGLGLKEWVAKRRAAGQIRNVGFSFHGGTLQFKALIDAWDWDFCQIQLNYMDERTQAGVEGLEYAAAKGLPVVIMEPLRGGKLAAGLPKDAQRAFDAAQPKRSPAEWGLRWLWDRPEVTVVLSGMNDISQVEENCRVASDSLPNALTAADMDLYRRVLDAFNSSTRVNCTGCGYCQPCPRGVDIPVCFAAFNSSYVDGLFTGMREYLMCTTLRNVRSNAGLCVKCGKCEQHCPQHLPIRDELDRVKKRLENPAYKIAATFAPKILKY